MTTATAELITDVAHYEKEAQQFEAIHEGNLESALLLIATFKRNMKELDAQRKKENDPHQDAIDLNNKKYNPAIRFCDVAWKAIDRRVQAYRDEQERLALEAQQREIEAANKAREEAEALARIAQAEADKQRVEGNQDMADVLESQAQTLELEGALAIPRVLPTVQKSYALPTGGSINYRKVNDWMLPGFTKDAKLGADSVVFAKADWNQIKRLFTLDPVKVNAVLKADGKLPMPFVVTTKTITTSR